MKRLTVAALWLFAVALTGCGKPEDKKGAGGSSTTNQPSAAAVNIKADGSSTVFLITREMATAYKKTKPHVNISIGVSGTGGGFKKFAKGETDIQDASRAIKPSEAQDCKKNGVEYLELQVALDGLAVVINKDNDWATQMTVEQLKKIWHPDTRAEKWSDIDPKWPAEKIDLYGPGPESGTFDYFTEAINGKEKVSRTDYNPSENDNIIVQGVTKNKYAMGYFGVAYYEGHKDALRAVAIAPKAGAPYVLPEAKEVLAQRYRPLSRPLFIYVKLEALKNPEIQEFVRFYLRRDDLVREAKYVQQTSSSQQDQMDKLNAAIKALK